MFLCWGGGGGPTRFARTKSMTSRARKLRGNLTDAEQMLLKSLHRNRIRGLSFRRQHPIGTYVLDFYCAAAHLAIEVDGGQHASGSTKERDQRRDLWLAMKGIQLLRFWNNEVLSNLNGVLEKICMALDSDETPSRRKSGADQPP